MIIFSYRTREEVQEVRQTRDPITSFREKIISANLVESDELKVSICYYNFLFATKSIVIAFILLKTVYKTVILKKKSYKSLVYCDIN